MVVMRALWRGRVVIVINAGQVRRGYVMILMMGRGLMDMIMILGREIYRKRSSEGVGHVVLTV